VKVLRGWILPVLLGAGIPLLASTTHWMWLWYLWIAISVVFFAYVIWDRFWRVGT